MTFDSTFFCKKKIINEYKKIRLRLISFFERVFLGSLSCPDGVPAMHDEKNSIWMYYIAVTVTVGEIFPKCTIALNAKEITE